MKMTKMKSQSAGSGDSDSSPRRFGHHHPHSLHSGRNHHMKSSLAAAAAAAAVSSSASGHHSSSSEHEDSNSPPMSPLRLPQLSSSSSSIYSWPFSDRGSHSSQSSQSSEDGDSQPALCNSNSKEDRSSYNTKFARYHLETYRRNDQMRWNFDFDHNRPLDDQHHHHHQTAARYQWEPAI